MSAPREIKSTTPQRQRRATKPQLVSPAQLDNIEVRAALAFRNLKPETKQAWLEMLEGVAADHQLQLAARRPVRALRLVAGGAR